MGAWWIGIAGRISLVCVLWCFWKVMVVPRKSVLWIATEFILWVFVRVGGRWLLED
ncbi:MAG: hypothetical protein RLZZ458_2667 [Planctomycetota bacterium]|jgi:hypothetical protein